MTLIEEYSICTCRVLPVTGPLGDTLPRLQTLPTKQEFVQELRRISQHASGDLSASPPPPPQQKPQECVHTLCPTPQIDLRNKKMREIKRHKRERVGFYDVRRLAWTHPTGVATWAAEDCGVWHGAKLQCGKPGMVVMGTQLCESTLRKLRGCCIYSASLKEGLSWKGGSAIEEGARSHYRWL